MQPYDRLRNDVRMTLIQEYDRIIDKIKNYENFLMKERDLRNGLQKIIDISKNDNELASNTIVMEYLSEKVALCDSMIKDFTQFRDEEIEERERYEHEWPDLFKKD